VGCSAGIAVGSGVGVSEIEVSEDEFGTFFWIGLTMNDKRIK